MIQAFAAYSIYLMHCFRIWNESFRITFHVINFLASELYEIVSLLNKLLIFYNTISIQQDIFIPAFELTLYRNNILSDKA